MTELWGEVTLYNMFTAGLHNIPSLHFTVFTHLQKYWMFLVQQVGYNNNHLQQLSCFHSA